MQGASIDHKTQYLEIQSSFGPTMTDVRGPRLLVIWENSSRTSKNSLQALRQNVRPESGCLELGLDVFEDKETHVQDIDG